MLTIYTLASLEEKDYIEKFWKHLALARRQMQDVNWMSPLYVENRTTESQAVVPAMLGRYIAIGCMSVSFVSALLDEPALREMVNGAICKIPFEIVPCNWDEEPCPFTRLNSMTSPAITIAGNKDIVFTTAVNRLKAAIKELL